MPPAERRSQESAMQGPCRTLHMRSLPHCGISLVCTDSRMDHDNESSQVPGRPVTALLVPAISQFFSWTMVLIPMRRAISTCVVADVVDENHSSTISNGSRYRSSRAYSPRCRRHHHDDHFAVHHDLSWRSAVSSDGESESYFCFRQAATTKFLSLAQCS